MRKSISDGYLKAHAAANLQADEQYIHLVSPRQEQGAESVVRQLSLARPPTALIIGSSELTIGSLGAIRRARVEIPMNISVVGYGDPVWFQLLSPALTAIPLPVESLVEACPVFCAIRRRIKDVAIFPFSLNSGQNRF